MSTRDGQRDVTTGPSPEVELTLEEVFDLLPAGVIALDRNRRVHHVNPSGYNALGLSPAEAGATRAVAGLVSDATVSEALRAAELDGEERRIVLFFEGRPGLVKEIGLSVVPQAPVALAAGNKLGSLLVFRALDSGRSLDQRMREIEHLAAVGRLAAGFAHEVRNPIAAIQGLAECLTEELPADLPQVEYARRIVPLVDRIEALVKSCLELGEAPDAAPAPIEPALLVNMALRRAGLEQQVTADIEPGTPAVLANPIQVIECLCSLLSNAAEAATSTPEIRLRVHSSSPGRRRVVFEVIDRGEGIPAALLGQVFEPFFTTKPGATGLGLTVARLVAARNRGSLEVHCPQGETIFSLSLPSAVDPAKLD